MQAVNVTFPAIPSRCGARGLVRGTSTANIRNLDRIRTGGGVLLRWALLIGLLIKNMLVEETCSKKNRHYGNIERLKTANNKRKVSVLSLFFHREVLIINHNCQSVNRCMARGI